MKDENEKRILKQATDNALEFLDLCRFINKKRVAIGFTELCRRSELLNKSILARIIKYDTKIKLETLRKICKSIDK